MRPTILVLHASGTNRDEETVRACELAGVNAEVVHINQLRAGQRRLNNYDMLILPGGFSYGDALGAGLRLALDLRVYLEDQLLEFADCGKLILGICNGFQALVKAGLLPGDLLGTEDRHPSQGLPAHRSVTLTANASGRFECRWVHLLPNRNAAAAYLAAIEEPIYCPIAHGEGRFRVLDEHISEALDESGCIAFRYGNADGSPAANSYPANPNGSVYDIAGICNRAGNILGLMPHPEDHIVRIQHPGRLTGSLGLQLFTTMIGSMR
jgi:phosphoribosylformylglycinamidine synthase subunit PurQ / glutaminase